MSKGGEHYQILFFVEITISSILLSHNVRATTSATETLIIVCLKSFLFSHVCLLINIVIIKSFVTLTNV